MTLPANDLTPLHSLIVSGLARVRTTPDSRILIVGYGLTGKSLCHLLSQAGYRVTVVDEQPIRDVCQYAGDVQVVERCMDRDMGQGMERFPWWYENPERYPFALTSPGISPASAVLRLLERTPQISEADFATTFLGRPLVAVTGTNGKTTTTSLIHAMLAASGREIYLAGNIGKPLVELLTPEQISAPELRPRKDPFFPMVAELSSYQLESSVGLSPHVGVWLNLSENHLERHKTMERYLDAKARLFAGQRLKGDFAVISASDSYAPQMKKRVRVGTSHTFPFARWTGGQASVTRDTVTQDTVTHGEVPHGEATHCEVTHCEVTHGEATHGTDTSRQAALPHRGSFYDAESGVITFFYHGEVEEYSVKRSPLLGAHNKMNIAAAIPAARICGATPEEVQRTIDTFQPIEHRLEFVRELGGVAYINDTKATTVGAAAAALDALYSELPERRIVLLLGGQAKHGSWEPLRERLERSCFAAICFGGDGAKILTELQSPAALERCALSRTEALEEALSRATLLAQPGDIVLLSPGCASFDAYKNFEERGHHFKSLVAALQPPP